MTESFWASKIGPQLPEPGFRADGEGYRQHMAQASGSRVYSPEYAAARVGKGVRPQSIYEPAAPKTLGDYGAPTTSRWTWDPAATTVTGYLARLRQAGILRADGVVNEDNFGELAPHDQAAVAAAIEKINTAETGDHDALRAVLTKREQGNGIQQTGHCVDQAMRFGPTREIPKEGHLAPAASNLVGVRMASFSDVAAARRAADEQHVPQRTAEQAAAMRGAR